MVCLPKKNQALVLFSGGLDSMLAVKLLEQQNIKVTAICFYSNFFDCHQAKKSAQHLNIPLLTIDISKPILELVKNPVSGRGKYLNPCLDCHALMFRKAAEIAKQKNFSFLASGEVLGQRPFSQNRQALNKVTQLAGVEVLRPLSAKLLPPTQAEVQGLVKRDQLLGLAGRRREKQIELAKQFSISYYPSPAGGCLLTQKEFSQRLSIMLELWPNCTPADVELLKYGRVFWFKITDSQQLPVLAVIGRDEKDNQQLEKKLQKQDYMLQLLKRPGPTALLRGYVGPKPDLRLKIQSPKSLEHQPGDIIVLPRKDIFLKTAQLIAYYTPTTRGQEVEIKISC